MKNQSIQKYFVDECCQHGVYGKATIIRHTECEEIIQFPVTLEGFQPSLFCIRCIRGKQRCVWRSSSHPPEEQARLNLMWSGETTGETRFDLEGCFEVSGRSPRLRDKAKEIKSRLLDVAWTNDIALIWSILPRWFCLIKLCTRTYIYNFRRMCIYTERRGRDKEEDWRTRRWEERRGGGRQGRPEGRREG